MPSPELHLWPICPKLGLRGMRSIRVYVLLELGEILAVVILIIVLAQFVRIPLWVAVAIPAGKLLKFILVYPSVRRSGKQPVAVGIESLLGKRGLVVDPLDPEGYVNIRGELWRARSADAPIPAGAEIEVCGLDRSRLMVRNVE
jgi:membrane-bound ClpP family serine protease